MTISIANRPGAGISATDSEEAVQAFEAVLKSWNAAARDWDVEAFSQAYTDDAVLFGGRPGLSLGHEGIRGYFSSYVGVIRSTTLELEDQHVFRLDPDTFMAQGYGRFQLTFADGKQSQSVLRTTLVVVRRQGSWKVLQHHFSATPDAPSLGTV